MNNEEIRALSDNEITSAIKEEKKELLKMRFVKAISSIENTNAFMVKRRAVARLLTEQNKRKAASNN